jgi:hypothetical protein
MKPTTLKTSAAPTLVPTPQQIDALAREYSAAQGVVATRKEELKAATEAADQVKEKVIEMVRSFGGRHTEKSLRLAGLHSVSTVTTATLVQTDPDAIDKFRGYLGKQEIPGLAERFFQSHVTYSLVTGPSEVLKTLDLPARIRTRITALLGLCFTVGTKSPSLKVDLATAEKPARAERAG